MGKLFKTISRCCLGLISSVSHTAGNIPYAMFFVCFHLHQRGGNSDLCCSILIENKIYLFLFFKVCFLKMYYYFYCCCKKLIHIQWFEQYKCITLYLCQVKVQHRFINSSVSKAIFLSGDFRRESIFLPFPDSRDHSWSLDYTFMGSSHLSSYSDNNCGPRPSHITSLTFPPSHYFLLFWLSFCLPLPHLRILVITLSPAG